MEKTRQEKIREYLQKNKLINATLCSELLDTSYGTAERELIEMELAGEVTRMVTSKENAKRKTKFWRLKIPQE